MCTNRKIKMAAISALMLSNLAAFAQNDTVIKGEGDKKVKVIVKENTTVMMDTVKGGDMKDVKVIVKDKTTGADKQIVIMKRIVVNDSTNVEEVMKDIESGDKPGVAGKRKEIIIIDAGALEEAGEDLADRIEDKIDLITDKIEEKMDDVEIRIEKSKKDRVIVIEEEENEAEKEVELRVENQTEEDVKVENKGDTTTVRLKGRKIIITKDGDGTHVSVKKAEGEDGDEDSKRKGCCEGHRAKVKTDGFGLDLGFNQYFTNNQVGEIGDNRMNLNNWKSLNVTCHFLPTTFPLTRKGYVNLKSAISLDMNNFRFSDKYNYLSGSTDNGLTFETSPTALTKNKLLATYAQIPLLLNFKTNPCNEDKSVSFSVGGYAGMLIGSRGKRITEGNKFFVEEDLNLSKFKYGVTFRVDYKILDFYVNYNLSSLFETGKGPNTQIVAAGVNLLDF